MCLIVFSWRQHPAYRLVMTANRDEFYDRPASPLHWWKDTGFLAGRDLEAGGTWMGVSRDGRFAAVTNVRDAERAGTGAASRGVLVSDFLAGDQSPDAYIDVISRHADRFDGFNLLAGNRDELLSYSNRGSGPARLAPGLYGLSNHQLDTAWPKVVRSKRRLARILESPQVSPDAVLEMLTDGRPAEDHELPDTGIGRNRERALSSPFIRTPDYGTRVSSLLLIDHEGRVEFHEWGHVPAYETVERFVIDSF